MQKGTVFRGFKEHLITFKPTYKYLYSVKPTYEYIPVIAHPHPSDLLLKVYLTHLNQSFVLTSNI